MRIDALLQPVVLGEIAAPPASPGAGDCYIVAQSATGDWTGQEGALAVWAETQWLFARPREGARVHDVAIDALAVSSTAGGWLRAPVPVLPTGGSVQDLEARAVLAEIVTKLHGLRIFSV